MHDLINDPLFWLAISFFIFLGILWYAARPVLLAGLDGRIQKIKAELEEAQNLKLEALALLDAAKQKYTDPEGEAERIVKAAAVNAHRLLEQTQRDLDEVLERKEKQLSERIERMKLEAISEIQAYAADLAVNAAAAIIAKKLDAAADDRLIEHGVKTLPGDLN